MTFYNQRRAAGGGRFYWAKIFHRLRKGKIQDGTANSQLSEVTSGVGVLESHSDEWNNQLLEFFSAQVRYPKSPPKDLARDIFGFNLKVKPSNIKNAGLGLFLCGNASKGHIIAMYPGLVYRSFQDPIMLASIHNHYIIQTSHKYFIDGKPNGLSGYLFRSIVARDSIDGMKLADTNWMDISAAADKSPFSLGQFANDSKDLFNVTYQEHVLPACPSILPWEHLQYVPNIPLERSAEDDGESLIRATCLLVATRDIIDGEEILASYLE